MAANGDLFHPLRTWAFLLPVLIILIAIGSFVLRRPLSKRFYWVSLFVIVVAALLPLLPNVDNGYKQAYWIGDDMYSIPWRYAPYNGKDAPGGKSFVIQLKPTSLKPLHSSDEGGTITVIVSSDTSVFDAQPNGDAFCVLEDPSSPCFWTKGDRSFRVSGDTEHIPIDAETFAKRIEALIEGFAG